MFFRRPATRTDSGRPYGPNTSQVRWLLAALAALPDEGWIYLALTDYTENVRPQRVRAERAAQQAWGRGTSNKTLEIAARDAAKVATAWLATPAAVQLLPGLQRQVDEWYRRRGMAGQHVDRVMRDRVAGAAAMMLVLRPLASPEDFVALWQPFEPVLSVLRDQMRRPLILEIRSLARVALAMRDALPAEAAVPIDPNVVADLRNALDSVAELDNSAVSTAALDQIAEAADRATADLASLPEPASESRATDREAFAAIAVETVRLLGLDEIYREGAQFLNVGSAS